MSFEMSETRFDMLEDVSERVLAFPDILSGLRNINITMTPARVLRDTHSEEEIDSGKDEC